jgi:hypothetical protein
MIKVNSTYKLWDGAWACTSVEAVRERVPVYYETVRERVPV